MRRVLRRIRPVEHWRVVSAEPHASGRTAVTSVRGKSVRIQLID